MTTLRSTSLGMMFRYEYVTNGWYDTINNGEHTSEEEGAIVAALTNAQVEVFNAMLPDGCYWQVETTELLYTQDIDAVDRDDLETYLTRSAEIVARRLPQIEAEALANLAA
jgi:hypothetical protein